jgi:hypothetical protein
MEGSRRFLDRIDWQRPWLAPLRLIAEPIVQAQDWRCALDAAAAERVLRNHLGLPIRFVRQEELPAGIAYEAFISETGCVPTRENLHDFFNALVWLTYPQIKVQLNALQAAEITSALKSSVQPVHRGKVRDAATIFDENAALLISCDHELIEILRAHRWQEAFVAQREKFQHGCEVRLFGHALMEKLVAPYKAITAHTWVVMVDASFFGMNEAQKKLRIDTVVADQLQGGLHTSGFTPLPVLGVPGWWAIQDSRFYADSTVFRPKRPAPLRAGLAADSSKRPAD